MAHLLSTDILFFCVDLIFYHNIKNERVPFSTNFETTGEVRVDFNSYESFYKRDFTHWFVRIFNSIIERNKIN